MEKDMRGPEPHARVRSVFLALKPGNPKAEAIAAAMTPWFRERGVRVDQAEAGPELFSRLRAAAEALDLILALGGDGTVLSVGRRAAGTGVPVLGVNCGNVGFLAEVPGERWQTTLSGLLESGFRPSPRLMLRCRIFRQGREIFASAHDPGRGLAVNEVSLSRGSLARLIDFDIRVNAERLGAIRCDGIIVSTPTGATGYSVSAGGPLVMPEMRAFTLTPVCPFLSFFPPLVVPDNARICAVVKKSGSTVVATLDGFDNLEIQEGDEVQIERHTHDLLLAVLNGYSYFGALRDKGFIRA